MSAVMHNKILAATKADETIIEKVVPSGSAHEHGQEDEPRIHIRTWIALLAIFILNYVQIIALISPTIVVRLVIT